MGPQSLTVVRFSSDTTRNPLTEKTEEEKAEAEWLKRIMKALACGHKFFDGPVRDIIGELPIHDDEQLKRWN